MSVVIINFAPTVDPYRAALWCVLVRVGARHPNTNGWF